LEPLNLIWRAQPESGVRPDLMCGISIAAINGAAIAGRPHT